MPFTPYVIDVTVTLSDVAQGGVNVTLRNDSTNETLSETTNSSGQVIFNLANLASGWTVGDVVTVFTLYTNYEASASHTTTTGAGTSISLSLTSVPSAEALRYVSVQDVFDHFDLASYDVDAENGIKPQQVVGIGVGVESEIDNICGSKFDSNSGSYYTATQEYHDGKRTAAWDEQVFFTKYRPIISVTTLQTTQSSDDTASGSVSWDTLTENQHFYVDKETGRIALSDDTYYPVVGRNRLRVTYTYGFASVPSDIKLLTTLMIGRELMKRKTGRESIRGREYRGGDLALMDSQVDKIIASRKRLIVKNV